MRRTFTALVATGMVASTAHAGPPAAAVPPEVAPPPALLLAQYQIDDSDLQDEVTLEELHAEEFDAEAWSMGSAIGLSFVPGGGFGLLYAEKPAAAAAVFGLSAIGYGVGTAYLLGVFDESSSQQCIFKGQKAPDLECQAALDITHELHRERKDPDDPRSPYYYQLKGDYDYETVGRDFDGSTTGALILAGTYAATTLLGAAWAASAVSNHNEELRKRIESTAGVRPLLGYTGREGVVGLTLDF